MKTRKSAAAGFALDGNSFNTQRPLASGLYGKQNLKKTLRIQAFWRNLFLPPLANLLIGQWGGKKGQ
jgi:hypothetical protein